MRQGSPPDAAVSQSRHKLASRIGKLLVYAIGTADYPSNVISRKRMKRAKPVESNKT
jgi:hypothetical protein